MLADLAAQIANVAADNVELAIENAMNPGTTSQRSAAVGTRIDGSGRSWPSWPLLCLAGGAVRTSYVQPAGSKRKGVMNAPHALPMLAALVVAQGAWASLELTRQKTCMACHAVDRKIVGPFYKGVAAKYAGRGLAGRKNHQGRHRRLRPCAPIPTNPKVSPAEALKLAQRVLSAK
jgi:cytochrome c